MQYKSDEFDVVSGGHIGSDTNKTRCEIKSMATYEATYSLSSHMSRYNTSLWVSKSV